MNLSTHFTLEEMIASQTAARLGIKNTPSEAAIENLTRLCTLLESVRALFGKSLNISSGFRNKAVNAAVGSKDTSQHIQGCAADFTIPGVSITDTIEMIVANNIPYDQLIHEFDSWVHISVATLPWNAPRKQTLIIDHNGTRPYA